MFNPMKALTNFLRGKKRNKGYDQAKAGNSDLNAVLAKATQAARPVSKPREDLGSYEHLMRPVDQSLMRSAAQHGAPLARESIMRESYGRGNVRTFQPREQAARVAAQEEEELERERRRRREAEDDADRLRRLRQADDSDWFSARADLGAHGPGHYGYDAEKPAFQAGGAVQAFAGGGADGSWDTPSVQEDTCKASSYISSEPSSDSGSSSTCSDSGSDSSGSSSDSGSGGGSGD